jgi:hypothetical protein
LLDSLRIALECVSTKPLALLACTLQLLPRPLLSLTKRQPTPLSGVPYPSCSRRCCCCRAHTLRRRRRQRRPSSARAGNHGHESRVRVIPDAGRRWLVDQPERHGYGPGSAPRFPLSHPPHPLSLIPSPLLPKVLLATLLLIGPGHQTPETSLTHWHMQALTLKPHRALPSAPIKSKCAATKNELCMRFDCPLVIR